MEASFIIGESDFLLNGRPLQIRCGEIHFARIPREYWRHRLQLCKAMGLNTVCAYLFWNYHEWDPGRFDWSDQADAAEFCLLAREEGLWVILRPGPYACAEWEMGGLPWWLLKNPAIQLRSMDGEFLAASRRWLLEVGRVLAPLQVTRGGPILMVQAENEYGFYGSDTNYMGVIREFLLDAGFDVPLFACNPVYALENGRHPDLFPVVNFGGDPDGGFASLRKIMPSGPLMCGEFYPGWFDTWGAPHHCGDTDRYLGDLERMLERGASFSIYMAHGGTSFGLWAGADQPFKPDTSSYDYDAPISEAGWIGDKFWRTRALLEQYLSDGETLPLPPAPSPTMAIARFELTECAPLFDNLPAEIADRFPRTMESYDQGRGCILYRTTIPAGPAAALDVCAAHDFAWVFIDGVRSGVMDRRSQRFRVALPARSSAARLDILVEAMGRVNFGEGVHDRKGIHAPVRLLEPDADPVILECWNVCPLGLGPDMLASLQWGSMAGALAPAFWRGHFEATHAVDTFLDVSSWGKGVLWVNGRPLGRFWNIGPTQTMYLPGAWVQPGLNEVIVLDLVGPDECSMAGQETPVLDRLRPEQDFARTVSTRGSLRIDGVPAVHTGRFVDGPAAQDIFFCDPVTGRQICFESLSAQHGEPFAAIAEIDLLDAEGKSIPHIGWTIAYVSSEEVTREDGSALNAIDGQTANYWHSEWSVRQPDHPHHLVIDLGRSICLRGLRYTPRTGTDPVNGRVKDYRIYVADVLYEEFP